MKILSTVSLSVCISPFLNAALKFPKTTVFWLWIALVSTAIPVSRMGSEFMPPLYEGSLLYMPMTLPGRSPAKMREILQVTNRQLMAMPEVESGFRQGGTFQFGDRSRAAEHDRNMGRTETPRPMAAGMTPEKLIAEMDKTGSAGYAQCLGLSD
jgi:Cu(I)/Ag(I) efflux system membrane protein CusA/SilA